MKTLIIYKSVHRKNTEKLAKVMAQAMNADLAKVEDIRPEVLESYDLIGFGSGIYASKLHNKLFKFIRKMPDSDKKVFIFCTSGSGEFKKKQLIIEQLERKGCTIVAEFNCSGEFSPFGFNMDKKGHPDENDFEKARLFAAGLAGLLP
ncbi:flavodoxin domain-containing protein [Paenibacillus sp. S150]|uniref:flavodoxin domain-containing protein n=1 Tax=Paenibacillus sp. S150 TaxID=2749826 RepID=UPI001C56CF38|nr:flavodoxin domain-containing protein [Paenibacillus sp. S150]MBW4083077.1 flavodoxin [Paenibacillus sp. S150]